ncbi:MAG: tRNA (guanine-N7)-methyltransferase [Polyangiaceae bacterium]|nr:tRNA (guanine-N7)-methyltransferase [Polyangiaceae bacterium]
MTVDLHADAPRLPEGLSLDLGALLGGDPWPVELELGPGRGGFIVERLRIEPSVRMVGLEIRRKWAATVDQRLRRLGLAERGRVFAEDAREAVPRLRPASVSVVYANFPDPWWKRRHRKRLLLVPGFLCELCRVLVPGGELFVQTDVPERARAYEALVRAHTGFEPWGNEARVADNPRTTPSPRERRACADGLPIFRLRWRRI